MKTYHHRTKRHLFPVVLMAIGLYFSGVAYAVTIVDSVLPANRIDYQFFSFGGGSLSIAVNSNFFDTHIRLFADDQSPIGALTGAHIGANDDGGPGLNSLLNLNNLQAGDYVLAVGAFLNRRIESRSGIASSPSSDGFYQANYDSIDGDVSVTAVRNSRDHMGFSSADLNTDEIPVPPTLALFGLGLAGVGLRRWRRSP